MKKVLTVIMLLLVLCLVSCAAPPINKSDEDNQTSSQTVATSEQPTQTHKPTVDTATSPESEPTAEATPEQTPFQLIRDYPEDLVILSDDNHRILCGYASGGWLSHSNAAAYCDNQIEFYGYDLYGKIDVRPSIGVCEYLGDFDGFSVIAGVPENIYDWNADYHLIIKDRDITTAGNRKAVSPIAVLNIAPNNMSEIKPIKNTSGIQALVQNLLDNEYGDDTPEANVTAAIEVDIDNDGDIEIVFNSHNLIYPRYFPEDDPNYEFSGIEHAWYTIVAVIESDGQIYFAAQNYGFGFMEDCQRYEAAAVADVDGDGRCELIIDCEGWEWFSNKVFVYDGSSIYCTVEYDWVT